MRWEIQSYWDISSRMGSYMRRRRYLERYWEAKLERARGKQRTKSLEQVRAVLAEKSRAGHTAAIWELLRKYGTEKLSLVDPQHYEALLKDVEGLADAT